MHLTLIMVLTCRKIKAKQTKPWLASCIGCVGCTGYTSKMLNSVQIFPFKFNNVCIS